MRIRILLWAACLVPLGVLARPLTPDDVYRWQYLTEPRISPDGRWIAYTLGVPNRLTDSDDSHVWLVSWDGKQARQLLGGSEDVNVPLVGSKQMYQALRRLGVPTELVIYPGEYHDLSRPSFRVDRADRYNQWYDRFLKSN